MGVGPIARARTVKKAATWKAKPMYKALPDDIIIPVMGPTGVGKSTFIDYLSRGSVKIGHDLKSCTADLQPVIILPSQHAALGGRRLVIVDTPGFNDTTVPDSEILSRIASWLAYTYSSEMKLGGVIYLHDISLSRMLGTTLKNLEVFQKLCGDNAFRCVILGTTKWGDTYKEDGDLRIQQLCDKYWRDMLKHGSRVYQFEDSTTSAWTMVESIVKIKRDTEEVLQIQRELVDALKRIPDTEAGQKLRGDLDQVLKKLKEDRKAHKTDESKRQELNLEILRVREQMKILQVPISERVLGFLSLGIDRILDAVALTPHVSEPSIARLRIDCNLLVLLFGESREVKQKLLNLLSAEELSLGNDENSPTQEIKCWSVAMNEPPLVIIDTPDFDLHTNPRQVVQKTRTWLETSCREDMVLGIIYLKGFDPASSTGSRPTDDIDHSSLQSSADAISPPVDGMSPRASNAGGPLEQSTPVEKATQAAAASPGIPRQVHPTSPLPAHVPQPSVGFPLDTETTPFLPTAGSLTRESLETGISSSRNFGPVKVNPKQAHSASPPPAHEFSDGFPPVTGTTSFPPTAGSLNRESLDTGFSSSRNFDPVKANPKNVYPTSPLPTHEASVGSPPVTETTSFPPTAGSFTRESLDTGFSSSRNFGSVEANPQNVHPTSPLPTHEPSVGVPPVTETTLSLPTEGSSTRESLSSSRNFGSVGANPKNVHPTAPLPTHKASVGIPPVTETTSVLPTDGSFTRESSSRNFGSVEANPKNVHPTAPLLTHKASVGIPPVTETTLVLPRAGSFTREPLDAGFSSSRNPGIVKANPKNVYYTSPTPARESSAGFPPVIGTISYPPMAGSLTRESMDTGFSPSRNLKAIPQNVYSASPLSTHESSVGSPPVTEASFPPTAGSLTRESLDTVSLSSQTFGPVKAERETPDRTTSVTPTNGSDNNKPVASKPSEPPTQRRLPPTTPPVIKSSFDALPFVPSGDTKMGAPSLSTLIPYHGKDVHPPSTTQRRNDSNQIVAPKQDPLTNTVSGDDGNPPASTDRVAEAKQPAKRLAASPPRRTSRDSPWFLRSSKGLQSTLSLAASPADVPGSSALALGLFQGSALAKNMLFATLTTKPKTQRSQIDEADAVSDVFDGDVVEFRDTPHGARNMLDTALEKALPLAILLDDLIPLEGETNNKGGKFKLLGRFGRLFH